MFERLKKFFGRLAGAPVLKRYFNAARLSRLTADWVHGPTRSANDILRNDLRQLRERSRDLARNDPYAKRFLSLVQNNVIGHGITLQIRPSGKPLKTDAELSKIVEESFYRWGRKDTCTVSGRLNWRQAQRTFVRHLARDGEALVRIVYPKSNPFRFAIKLYSPAWLDENYNDTTPDGNRIIMSVEVDEFDKPVAYWFTQPINEWRRRQPDRHRTRIPASEIIHAFLCEEDEDQARGIPWIHASMIRLRQFDGYEEAEIVGKRAEACQMAFVTPPVDEIGQTTDTEDDEGNRLAPIQEMEPGIIAELPPGYTVNSVLPKQDSGASDFKKATLRGVAAGVNVSYHSLVGDLEAVNYSSAKIGGLEEREFYKMVQDDVISDFCEPVYRLWLQAATLSGQLQLTPKQLERVTEPMFRPRGWTWVEPQKEANAFAIGLEKRFTTLTDILAERGVDIEDHFETIRKERELAKSYGIDLEAQTAKPATEPEPLPEE